MRLSPLLALALPALSSAHTLQVRSTVDCSYDTPAGAGETCDSFSSKWSITVAQLVSLNPGLKCPSDLVEGQNYCVIGTVVTSTTAMTKTTSSKATATSSTAHQPQQSGLAANCNKFYQVSSGDSCNSIEAKFGITAAEFNAWNRAINSQCSNLLAGYYVCVGVPGATHTTSMSKTTPTNGITTPTPTQTGMVSNCNHFYKVQSGDTCASIASNKGIPLDKFYAWNPAVGKSCGALWKGYYVCVDVVGYTPSTKTTSAGNGITTPTPYEPGMVGNCNSFYYVQSGDTCQSVASKKKITVGNIEKWNPKVGSSCTDLWKNTYICVGVK